VAKPAIITNSIVDELTDYEWQCIEAGLGREFVGNLHRRSGMGVAGCHAVWLGLRESLGYEILRLDDGPGEPHEEERLR
jgi:hypothetical protein